MNTTEFLTITSAIVPDRLAMVFEDRRITFEQMQQRANRLANALESLGVGSGDRIAILQVNCAEYVEAYFAAAKLDAIFVPLNFRARVDELTYMVNDSEPKVLLVGRRYLDLVRSCCDNLRTVQHYVSLEERAEDMTPLKSPLGKGGRQGGWHFYDDLIASAPDDERFPTADGDNLTVIMFTAGTTGFPKGVMLSHDSFASYILSNVM
ncbi:MAG: AMP-binding protein, partial [Chloroflexi bacterium]|nr:AMP-binding protein [Chloroflexota bacterium]